jgi:hypothetical protein
MHLIWSCHLQGSAISAISWVRLFVGGLRVQVQLQVQITFDFIRHDVRVY